MTIKVLTINSERDSASLLGYKTETYYGDFVHKSDNDVVIRWGNSRGVYDPTAIHKIDFKHVVNPAKNIRSNCEKAKATKLLSQVVNVPTLWEKSVPAGVLAVVRPFEHSAGRGFSVKKGPFKLEEGTYATRYLDVTKVGAEYRVWFCGNRTMVGKRVKMQCNEEQEHPCRSLWGYQFSDTISKDLHVQTILAAKKIGLEFGAADVLFHKGKWYFLELNSAPSLDHRIVREFYQTNLKLLIEKKFSKVQETLVPVIEVVKPTESKKKDSPVAVEVGNGLVAATTG